MTRSERAQQAWQILTGCAANRQVSSYAQLEERTATTEGPGLPRRAWGEKLGHIVFYCRQRGLPPLTVLAVRKTRDPKKNGKPGPGLFQIIEPELVDHYREEVFDFPWQSLLPPTAEDLRLAYVSGMRDQGKEPKADDEGVGEEVEEDEE